MSFPKSISIVNCFSLSSILILLLYSFFIQGCSVTKLYQEIPPSNQALNDINSIYINQFNGIQSVLFEKILSYEIEKHIFFENLKLPPENYKKKSTLLNVDVTRYFANDIEEIIKQKKTILVEKETSKKNRLRKDEKQRKFDFIEKKYEQRAIHRTLDLEFSFKLTNVEEKILITDKQNASLKLSYIGDEKILLIPNSIDEITRLAQSLIQKFLDKINPEPKEIIVELEKGTNPLPWTLGLVDFGHPRIIRSNHYAIGKKLDLALKGWNYVLFEPKSFPESENFLFSNEVFLRLKKANLPHSILQTLLDIRGKSFNHKEINIILLGLISNRDFERYSKIIKYHARLNQKIDRTNLASAHFNLGSVYKLKNKLELAAYHFSQANSYNPQEKYSQSWIKIQHLIGNYNPIQGSNKSIESFKEMPPPESALLLPSDQ